MGPTDQSLSGIEQLNAVGNYLRKSFQEPPSVVATAFGYFITGTGTVATLLNLRKCYSEGCSFKNITMLAISISATTLGMLQVMSDDTLLQPAMPEYLQRFPR